MRAAIKCVHPLLIFGIVLSVPLLLALPNGLADIIRNDQGGPCGEPVFLIFVPGGIMVFLGLGFSAIRVFELRAEKRKAAERRDD